MDALKIGTFMCIKTMQRETEIRAKFVSELKAIVDRDIWHRTLDEEELMWMDGPETETRNSNGAEKENVAAPN